MQWCDAKLGSRWTDEECRYITLSMSMCMCSLLLFIHARFLKIAKWIYVKLRRSLGRSGVTWISHHRVNVSHWNQANELRFSLLTFCVLDWIQPSLSLRPSLYFTRTRSIIIIFQRALTYQCALSHHICTREYIGSLSRASAECSVNLQRCSRDSEVPALCSSCC